MMKTTETAQSTDVKTTKRSETKAEERSKKTRKKNMKETNKNNNHTRYRINNVRKMKNKQQKQLSMIFFSFSLSLCLFFLLCVNTLNVMCVMRLWPYILCFMFNLNSLGLRWMCFSSCLYFSFYSITFFALFVFFLNYISDLYIASVNSSDCCCCLSNEIIVVGFIFNVTLHWVTFTVDTVKCWQIFGKFDFELSKNNLQTTPFKWFTLFLMLPFSKLLKSRDWCAHQNQFQFICEIFKALK